jgi:hypothetical protein
MSDVLNIETPANAGQTRTQAESPESQQADTSFVTNGEPKANRRSTATNSKL